MNSNIVPWNEVIKREARGINYEDFSRVQEIQGKYVLVQRGLISKEDFYIPKERVESYEGKI